MAIMANDACGAPIPFEICLPTFFDGKLFHFKLRRAASARNLMELCDGRVEMARQVTLYFDIRRRRWSLNNVFPGRLGYTLAIVFIFVVVTVTIRYFVYGYTPLIII